MTLPFGISYFSAQGNFVSLYGTSICKWTSSASHVYNETWDGTGPWTFMYQELFAGGAQWAHAVIDARGSGQYVEARMHLTTMVNYFWRASFQGDLAVWDHGHLSVWEGDLNQSDWAYRAGVSDNYLGIRLWSWIDPLGDGHSMALASFVWTVEIYCVNDDHDLPPVEPCKTLMIPEFN